MHTLRVLSYIAKSPNWKALPVYVLSKGESICLSSFSLSQGIIIKKKKIVAAEVWEAGRNSMT